MKMPTLFAAAGIAASCLLGAGFAAGDANATDDRRDDGAREERDDDHDVPRPGRYCSRTAEAMHQSCGLESRAEYHKARAVCINVSDAQQREQCRSDARTQRSESRQLCRAQFLSRLDACRLLGESRYDPPFDPAAFDSDFRALTRPNPYFPLAIGNRWEYRKGTESVVVRVLDRTKLIEGVTCIVVRDQVRDEGRLIEDTDDWFAQAKNGDVHYCGEEVKNYGSFDGDRPRRPELLNTDGSFKWGRDGDKGGVFFRGQPRAGDIYREEFAPGTAEDVAEVLSTTYAYGADADLDRLVPQALAERFCRGDCIVTRNWSLLEPGAVGRKYYAAGVGLFLDTNPGTGEVSSLVSCNFDARCTGLPAP